MKITVIDFETANYSRASACAIGVAVIEEGTVTVRLERLIKPPKGCGWFRDDFIGIHGITHEDVCDAPQFDSVFQELRPLFNGAVLAAHNAAFDIGVLSALCVHYGLPLAGEYLCTLQAARSVWPDLPTHNLKSLAAFLGVALNHHQAGSDAYAAATILTAIRAGKGQEADTFFTSRLRHFSV